jgi:YHS domain-containing protein
MPPAGRASSWEDDMAGYDRSRQDDEARQGDVDDVGGTDDVGDSGDVQDTRSMFDGELQPARFDLMDSIDEDDLTMVDPVCGNRVEMTSLYSAGYRGRTYIFDTQECRDTFLASPEVYIAAA